MTDAFLLPRPSSDPRSTHPIGRRLPRIGGLEVLLKACRYALASGFVGHPLAHLRVQPLPLAGSGVSRPRFIGNRPTFFKRGPMPLPALFSERRISPNLFHLLGLVAAIAWIGAMGAQVFGEGKGDKVGRVVVSGVAVYVVDVFPRFKQAPVGLLPHQPMLLDVPLRAGSGVVGCPNLPILAVFNAPSLPCRGSDATAVVAVNVPRRLALVVRSYGDAFATPARANDRSHPLNVIISGEARKA